MPATILHLPSHRNVKSCVPVDPRPRDYLTEPEMDLFIKAAKQGRHGDTLFCTRSRGGWTEVDGISRRLLDATV
jgi:hypothetical protein